MNTYVLLGCSILLALANNILLRLFKNRGLDRMCDVLFFNAVISIFWAFGMLIYNRGFGHMSLPTVLWGLVYGVVMGIFLLSKMMAFSTGPMSLSSLAGCSSLILTTFLGALFWSESISMIQIIGVLILLGALLMCVYIPGGNDKTITVQWIIWALAYFLLSGVLGLVLKIYYKSSEYTEINQFFMIGGMVAFIILLAISCTMAVFKKEVLPHLPKQVWPWLITIAIVTMIYNRLNIYLAGILPSVIFFPCYNGGLILGSTALGALVLKERLRKVQVAGIIIGMVAIFMIGNLFLNLFG